MIQQINSHEKSDFKKWAEKMVCKARKILRFDFECKEEYLADENNQPESENIKVDNYWKSVQEKKISVGEINSKNIYDILNGLLYALRDPDNKNHDRLKGCLSKKILEKWHGEKSWLLDVKNNIKDEKYKDIPDLLNELDKLIHISSGSPEEMILNNHLIEDIDALIVKFPAKATDNSNNSNKNVVLAHRLVERIDKENENKSEYLNALFEVLATNREEWRYRLLFLLDIRHFDMLSEKYQHDIATFDSKELVEFTDKKYPSLRALYSFGYESIFELAKFIANDKDKAEVSLSELILVYQMIGIEEDAIKYKIWQLCEIFKKEGKEEEEDKKIAEYINITERLDIKYSDEIEIIHKLSGKYLKELQDVSNKKIINFNSDKGAGEIEINPKVYEDVFKEFEEKYLFTDIEKIKDYENKYREFVDKKLVDDKKKFLKDYILSVIDDEALKKAHDDNLPIITKFYSDDIYYKCIEDLNEEFDKKDSEADENKKAEFNKIFKKEFDEYDEYNKKQAAKGHIQTLLYIAKGIALEKESKEITLEHIDDAMRCLYVDGGFSNEKIIALIKVISVIANEGDGKKAEEYFAKGIDTEERIQFDELVKIFKKLFEDYLDEDKSAKIFDYKKTKDVDTKLDDIYYEVLEEFAKRLFDAKEYKASSGYWEKYYEEKKDFNSLYHTVESLNKSKKYSKILNYEDAIKKCADKLKVDAKIEDTHKERVYKDTDKRKVLVLLDSLITAYIKTKFDNKAMEYLEILISQSKDVVDSKTIDFYADPVFKYIWLLEKIGKQKEAKVERDEHKKHFESLLEKVDDIEEYSEELEKILAKLEKEIEEQTDENIKRELEETRKIFKEVFIDTEKVFDAKSGERHTLLLLAKYEVIKAERDKIQKTDLEKASKYLCLNDDVKEFFKDHGLNEETQKIKPTDDMFLKAIKHEKIEFEDDVKDIIKNSDREKIYFKIFETECKQSDTTSKKEEVPDEETTAETETVAENVASEVVHQEARKIEESNSEKEKEEKVYTSKDMLLLAKYLSSKDRSSEYIEIGHLYKALNSFDITDGKLQELKEKSEGEGIEVREDVDNAIKEAEKMSKINYSDELKKNKIFDYLKKNMKTIVATNRQDSQVS